MPSSLRKLLHATTFAGCAFVVTLSAAQAATRIVMVIKIPRIDWAPSRRPPTQRRDVLCPQGKLNPYWRLRSARRGKVPPPVVMRSVPVSPRTLFQQPAQHTTHQLADQPAAALAARSTEHGPADLIGNLSANR